MEYQIVSIVDAVDAADAAAVAAALPCEVVSVGPFVSLLMFGQPVPRKLEPCAWAVIACRATDADVAALEAAGLDCSRRQAAPVAAAAPVATEQRSNYRPATDWNATAESVAADIDAAPNAPKGGL